MSLLAALGHMANLGQMWEIGQGLSHHREQIRWTRRNYLLDAQALKIDLLGAARDDVRGTYDTYIERLDTLLLLNALLLPFALNTLQFSDEFVPRTEYECPECVEAEHPGLAVFWVYLVGLCLVMPFWSLLMLLRCKLKLDSWLQESLDALQALRRDLIQPSEVVQAAAAGLAGGAGGSSDQAAQRRHEERLSGEQEQVVKSLGDFIVDHQDMFSELWRHECAPLVFWATRLLWGSACGAISLTGLMFWIFLINRKGDQNFVHGHFLGLLLAGLLAPAIYLVYQRCRKKPLPFRRDESSSERAAASALVQQALSRTVSARSNLSISSAGATPLIQQPGREASLHSSGLAFLRRGSDPTPQAVGSEPLGGGLSMRELPPFSEGGSTASGADAAVDAPPPGAATSASKWGFRPRSRSTIPTGSVGWSGSAG